jgi:ComF family protein
MWTRHAIQPLRRLALGALDAVLPARCLGCGALVDRQGSLCPSCWSGIDFLGAPLCACCGMPFEQNVGEGALCGGCIGRPPKFARARAVFRYDDSSRRLVLGFKHGDRLHGAPAYGKWMARAGAALLADASMIAPVPLHWTRLFRRRYNQSALLAAVLARESGVPLVPDLLIRRRRTPPQGRLSAVERRRNMRGAFALNKRFAKRVGGRRVLLVDDVFTTGATVGACARVLLAAGAAGVDVITLARVVRPGAFD